MTVAGTCRLESMLWVRILMDRVAAMIIASLLPYKKAAYQILGLAIRPWALEEWGCYRAAFPLQWFH